MPSARDVKIMRLDRVRLEYDTPGTQNHNDHLPEHREIQSQLGKASIEEIIIIIIIIIIVVILYLI